MKEKEINPEFNIPLYLFDSILDYLVAGKPESNWSSLYFQIKAAVANERITEYQAERIIEKIQEAKL